MRLTDIPFQTIDWASIAATSHPGETGVATWQTVEVGNVRVRLVRYSANYLADHWCERGHVIHVLEGTLATELRDGRSFDGTAPPFGGAAAAGQARVVETAAGHSYIVASGDGAHRSRTTAGALLFIVD